MSSKLTNAMVLEGVVNLRAQVKARKFRETVELQIGLKDYDPQKDKRFVGSVRLPNVPRPSLKICLIADAKHAEEAKKGNLDIDVKSLDELKTFNKDKIPQEILNSVQKLGVNNSETFNTARITQANRAAGGLAKWCQDLYKYAEALKVVLPKQQKVNELT